MLDFVAIDFETANSNPSSACQLAAVVVEKSKIVAEKSWLIRPPRLYFAPRNIQIHGIRSTHVADAPSMEGIWGELKELLCYQTIIAHNARFDINVLIHSLAAYDVACPELSFTCTRALARAAWPAKGSYGLKPLATGLGISFRHHDALEDARSCARIAIEIGLQNPTKDLEGLEKHLQVRRGAFREGKITSPRSAGRRSMAASAGSGLNADRWGFPSRRSKIAGGRIDAEALLSAAASNKPLAGKDIVLLGALRGLDMESSIELLSDLGAVVHRKIIPKVNYVVACGTSLEDASRQVCEQLSQVAGVSADSDTSSTIEGQGTASGVRVLSERQLLALLPGGIASLRW